MLLIDKLASQQRQISVNTDTRKCVQFMVQTLLQLADLKCRARTPWATLSSLVWIPMTEKTLGSRSECCCSLLIQSVEPELLGYLLFIWLNTHDRKDTWFKVWMLLQRAVPECRAWTPGLPSLHLVEYPWQKRHLVQGPNVAAACWSRV